MQPRRSYSRRLKSVKNEIYELFPSARRAYNSIRLAVKTKSTPICKELLQYHCIIHAKAQCFGLSTKETKIENFILEIQGPDVCFW